MLASSIRAAAAQKAVHHDGCAALAVRRVDSRRCCAAAHVELEKTRDSCMAPAVIWPAAAVAQGARL